ncbi:MAG: disulfide bond formation protein B [Gammaproteobacteria bacterium]|nr:disulfide bond formation protein B [Gammaproteobacteria bacterium]
MFSYRALNSYGLLACIASLLFAIIYLEGTLFLDPCPLCILDRLVLTALGLVFALALISSPKTFLSRMYGALAIAFSLAGVGLAGRHVWLQGLPADQVPECGPDLYFMLETLPILEVAKKTFTASGSCAEVQWIFAGLTIPQQTLILFIGLLALSLVLTFRTR